MEELLLKLEESVKELRIEITGRPQSENLDCSSILAHGYAIELNAKELIHETLMEEYHG